MTDARKCYYCGTIFWSPLNVQETGPEGGSTSTLPLEESIRLSAVCPSCGKRVTLI